MEIIKLTDVVVWAEKQIEEMRIYLVPSLGEDEFEELEQVKEFEAVKKVVNETIKRHSVYTNALKQDIASRDAKIERLEKEIEGRKECYTALKELMDTKYISINEHNKIVDQFKEEVKKLKEENEDLKIRDEELTKQVANKLYDIDSLRNYITELKKENKNIRKEIEKLTNEGDDGREGFERYIKYIISEEEGKFKEKLNKRFSEEVSKISIKRTEEALAKEKEETEVKGVGRTSSGRYPWGAKIIRCEKPDNFRCVYGYNCPVEAAEKCKFAKEWKSNIPCGEDAIE